MNEGLFATQVSGHSRPKANFNPFLTVSATIRLMLHSTPAVPSFENARPASAQSPNATKAAEASGSSGSGMWVRRAKLSRCPLWACASRAVGRSIHI